MFSLMSLKRPFAKLTVGIGLLFLLSGHALAQISVTSASASGLSGTATDPAGIVSMDIALRDASDSDYWNGSSFIDTWIRVAVNTTGPSNSKSWSYSISPELPTGIYFANVRANLVGGGTALSVSRTIFVDAVKPISNILAASATAVSGTASDGDGVGLSRVEVAIRDTSPRPQYWNGSSFVDVYSRRAATLQSDGTWSFALSPSLPPGTYVATSIAFDSAGNAQAVPFSSKVFTVADGVKPSSAITSASASGINGTASDNTGIDRVELAISNADGEFFDGSGFGMSYTRVTTSLSGSGSSVSWAYSLNPNLSPGSYRVVAIAFDISGNPQQTPFTQLSFNVEAQEPLRIMAVGDSITEGFDWPNDGISGDIRSYRYEFTNLMDSTSCDYVMVGALENTRFNANPLFLSNHEGYTAHRTDHFITGRNDGRLFNPGIINSMALHNPDVVMVHLGSNDIFQGQDVESTIAEIDTVIALILSANPDATVLLANVIPWYNTNDSIGIQAKIQQLGWDIIAYMQANPRSNVRFVNVTAGYNVGMMQADLIHPNSVGDAHIADAFFDALDNSGRCGAPGTL